MADRTGRDASLFSRLDPDGPRGARPRRTAMLTSTAAAAAILGLVAAPLAQAREIGAVAAANPLIEGAAPTADGRRALYIGARVVENERIFTSSQGSGQVLFDDQTTLTVSPGSDVVLDKYVYNPETDTGEIGLTLTKGAMRFIGGRLSKNRDAVVRTPTATIGIRGGMALLTIGATGLLKVVSIAGAYVKIDTGGETLFLSRPNAAAEVAGPGSNIQYLGLVDAATLDEIYSQFEIEGGGGAAVAPTDGQVAASGLVVVGSEELGGVYRDPVTTEGGEPSENSLLDPFIIGRDYLIDIIGKTPGGVPVLIGTPIAATGQGFFAGTGPFTTPSGTLVPNPAASGVYFAPGGTIPFVGTFAGSRIGVGPDGQIVSIPTELATPDDPYFFFAPETPGGPFGRGYFDEDAEFTIALFDFYENGEDEVPDLTQIGAAVIGEATPGQLSDVTGGSNLLVRNYALDFAVDGIDGGSILPYEILSLDPAANQNLMIIGDPSGPLLPSADSGETNGMAKAGLALFSVTGSGENQQSYFGGFARPWLSNGEAPTLTAQVFGLGSDSSTGESVGTRIDFGTIEDGSDPDSGNVFYGPDGKYVVVGTSARGLDDDPDVDFGSGTATIWGDGVSEQAFGFLGFGTSQGDVSVLSDDRFMIANTSDGALASLGLPPNAGGVEPNFGVFTGGYYASIRQVQGNGEGEYAYSEINRNHSAHKVSAVFDKSTNSATVTFKRTLEVHGYDARNLTFGGADHGSAFADDKTFIAESRQGVSYDEDDEYESESYGADGVLATSAATGNPVPYPDMVTYSTGERAVTTERQYLTWGHWAAEATNDYGDGYYETERHHAGTWVAGDLTRPTDLPTSGVVDHYGHAEVMVSRNGATYLDGGGYHLNFNFSNRQGVAEFRDLAGYDIDVNVSAQHAHKNGFDGSFAGVSPIDGASGLPTVGGSIDGAFFNGGGHAAAASAGSIGFSSEQEGNPLQASGVFAGEKAH